MMQEFTRRLRPRPVLENPGKKFGRSRQIDYAQRVAGQARGAWGDGNGRSLYQCDPWRLVPRRPRFFDLLLQEKEGPSRYPATEGQRHRAENALQRPSRLAAAERRVAGFHNEAEPRSLSVVAPRC